jgi:hypothetical protein
MNTAPIYIITFDGLFPDGLGKSRHKTGVYERDFDDCGKASTLRMIAEGQFEDWKQVLELADGVVRDVTEDFVRKVEAIRREDMELELERSDFDEHSTLNRAMQGV